MRVFARLFRLVWGDDVEHALRLRSGRSSGSSTARASGDGAMWTFLAAVSVVAALTGAASVRSALPCVAPTT